MQLLPPGKVAIVTGIGPGLGREIALGFAELGAKLAIGARNTEMLESVAAEIGGVEVLIVHPEQRVRVVAARAFRHTRCGMALVVAT